MSRTKWREDLELSGLERSLEKSLNAIEPDQRFIGRLRGKLVNKSEIELEKSNYMAAYLVAGMGLFVGISVFWVINQIFKGLRATVLRG